MKGKCICSVAIESGKTIEIPFSENPGIAKSFTIKRRSAIFYTDNSGKYNIPRGKREIDFPDYEEHAYNIHYGNPYYT